MIGADPLIDNPWFYINNPLFLYKLISSLWSKACSCWLTIRAKCILLSLQHRQLPGSVHPSSRFCAAPVSSTFTGAGRSITISGQNAKAKMLTSCAGYISFYGLAWTFSSCVHLGQINLNCRINCKNHPIGYLSLRFPHISQFIVNPHTLLCFVVKITPFHTYLIDFIGFTNMNPEKTK
jgi:hypothetical protein